MCIAVCCSVRCRVLQNVLQSVGVLQYDAVRHQTSAPTTPLTGTPLHSHLGVCWECELECVLQYVTVCVTVCVAVCVAECNSMLLFVALCCSVSSDERTDDTLDRYPSPLSTESSAVRCSVLQ